MTATDRRRLEAMPERAGGSALPARWRNPIGIAGAVIVGFVILTALFGRFIWTIDPNNPASTGCWRRAGRTRWAPTSSAATRSRASSTARRSRFRSARSRSRSRSSSGSLIGLSSGFYRGRSTSC